MQAEIVKKQQQPVKNKKFTKKIKMVSTDTKIAEAYPMPLKCKVKKAPYVYVEYATEPHSPTSSMETEKETYWVKPLSEHVEHAAKPQSLTRPETETDWLPMLRNNLILVSNLIAKLFRVAKLILDAIDKRYTYTFLLLVGTVAYFLYIMYFNVNEYVNEEKCFMAKIEKSGYLMKCFYYVMRYLKEPIL